MAFDACRLCDHGLDYPPVPFYGAGRVCMDGKDIVAAQGTERSPQGKAAASPGWSG